MARSPRTRLTAFTTPSTPATAAGNGAIVIDVGLDRVEVKGGEKRRNAFRMPHRYPHREITLKQTLDDALAEKASPAEDGHLSSRHCSVPRDAVLKFRTPDPAVRRHFQNALKTR